MQHPDLVTPGHRDVLKTNPPVLGATSLRLSGGHSLPLLEAHPGQPIDLSGRRPSLSAALAARRPYKTQGEVLRSPLQSGKENCIMTGGVVAKFPSTAVGRCEDFGNESILLPKTKMVAATQPFYIPAKVPEHQVVHNIPSPVDDDGIFVSTAMETDMDYHFEDDGLWISAIPVAHESRASISTNTTGTSTLVEDYNGSFIVDTYTASSANSVLSSAASITSTATASTDVYGWEEELDRKSSLETNCHGFRDVHRRYPTGNRSLGPRVRVETTFKCSDNKRKSLLYRVLNISRREIDEPLPMVPGVPCRTSA